eukprot:9411339-Pyramimonas_sp.AAC.1
MATWRAQLGWPVPSCGPTPNQISRYHDPYPPPPSPVHPIPPPPHYSHPPLSPPLLPHSTGVRADCSTGLINSNSSRSLPGGRYLTGKLTPASAAWGKSKVVALKSGGFVTSVQ